MRYDAVAVLWDDLEDATQESLKLGDEMLNPTRESKFVTMLYAEGVKRIMSRGGEYPPTAWDHDPVITGMKDALAAKKQLDFLGGQLLCIGSVDKSGNFKPSRFLTEVVVPNLTKDTMTFCSKESKRKPKMRKKRKSEGYYVRHRREMHYRTSEEEIIAHVHRGSERVFRHITSTDDKNKHIDRIRKSFDEVSKAPGNFRYRRLSSSDFTIVQRDGKPELPELGRHCIVQKSVSTKDGTVEHSYDMAEESHLRNFFGTTSTILSPMKDTD